jgi:hypothetical protein
MEIYTMKTKQLTSRATTTNLNVLAAVVAAATMLFSVNSFAVSDCKGLQNSACGAKASCRWVEGYQRKDNRKVKAFCRSYAAKVNVAKANRDRQKSTAVVKKKSSAATLSSKQPAGKK